MTETAARLATSLGTRYRIERELGAGGMATVYLAQDLKHDRQVALKVLKPELAAVLGAERFVVEIKTTASLQHPHILPLFDSGDADGQLYYVMPYIQGETIREKLNRETQFGVDEAVRIAHEVADALDYAHRRGVIHRDIKPENILLHDGRAMVMDFGIALAVSAAAGGRMTETGLSLGTPHYMSPEQATAEKEISPRSDVYSLASVLYEMLAGQPPHIGGAAQQVIMKIIAEPVQPVSVHRRLVPPNVTAAVARGLEKIPADRFENAKAFGDALLNPAYTNSDFGESTPGAIRPWKGVPKSVFALTAGVAAAALCAAAWLATRRPASQPKPVFRLEFSLPDTLTLDRVEGVEGSAISMSGDGSVIAFAIGSMSRIGPRRIWYRTSDQPELRPVLGTEGASNVALSPDGKRVAFVRGRSVFVVGLDGGPSTTIVADSASNDVGWTPDGSIIVSVPHRGLARFPATGGSGVPLSSIDRSANEAAHWGADVLPNGKGIIFVVAHNPSNLNTQYDVAVLDLRTGKHHILAHGVDARFAPSGHLVYVTVDGTLMAAPFDADNLRLTGPAIAVANGLSIRGGALGLAIASSGTLLYAAGAPDDVIRELVWVARDGRVSAVDSGWRAAFDAAALSPDGHRLAVSIQAPSREDVWIRQLDAGTTSKLTFDGTLNYRPSWNSDGSKVVFISNVSTGRPSLVAKRADGIGPTEGLAREQRSMSQGFVSRDGKWIIYRSNANEPGSGDILAMHMGDSVPIPLVATPAQERYPSLSPDGRWLAYGSDETQPAQVYVRPFPDVNNGRWTVSTAGGNEPLWSRSGNELFFINANNEMVAATVATGQGFSVQSQRVLFKLPAGVVRAISHQTFDISPDDQRFIMIRAVNQKAASDTARRPSSRIIVVQNWLEELQAKVPTKR